MDHRIHHGDNLPVLEGLDDGSVDLIYIDPPFNTGKRQKRTRVRTTRNETGDRVGFHGLRYETVCVGERAFSDSFDDYLAFLEPRFREAHRVLSPAGTLYVHLDYREVHYCKVLLDAIFGRDRFLNEIVWAYDYGGRTKKRWPPKHDNILVYVKDPKRYTFNADEVDRIPYMAPGLVPPEKAKRGKLPTDTWWHTIVPTTGQERTGYPTQKPLGVLRRIVLASSRPGDLVLDFFAGSGTTGAACLEQGRRFLLVDDNVEALEVMARRFAGRDDIEWRGYDPAQGTEPEDPLGLALRLLAPHGRAEPAHLATILRRKHPDLDEPAADRAVAEALLVLEACSDAGGRVGRGEAEHDATLRDLAKRWPGAPDGVLERMLAEGIRRELS